MRGLAGPSASVTHRDDALVLWSATTEPGGCPPSSTDSAARRVARPGGRVDTGSKDESADLLRGAFGDGGRRSARAVVRPRTPRPCGIGLERSPPTPSGSGSSTTTQPGARRARRAARRGRRRPRRPTCSARSCASGPRCSRLLEVGVTISGTGRRETGLEPGEYDQGQHDEVRQVLAVNTAGMLVRRRCSTSSAASTTSCRCSATTSTSAGARPRPGTGRSSCRRRSSSTPRPPTAASGGRR